MGEIIKRPEFEIKVGAVRASIWANPRMLADGKSFNSRKVIIERTYRGADGNFGSTGSFDVNDIPKAILALKKAYEYLVQNGSDAEAKQEIQEKILAQISPRRIP